MIWKLSRRGEFDQEIASLLPRFRRARRRALLFFESEEINREIRQESLTNLRLAYLIEPSNENAAKLNKAFYNLLDSIQPYGNFGEESELTDSKISLKDKYREEMLLMAKGFGPKPPPENK